MRSRVVLWLFVPFILGMGGIILSQNGLTGSIEDLAMRGIAPAQGAFRAVAAPLSSFLTAVRRASALQAENERQRQEIERLVGQIAAMREAEIENQRLRALLDFEKANPEWKFLPAAIIGRDTTNLLQSIVIDKGVNDGVEEGMAIVAESGLVGKVERVFTTSAKALLITDPGSSVNAMVQSSRALGVVKGQPGGGLVMEYVAEGEKVARGDLVITSGLGGGFPKGLVIGSIGNVEGSDTGMFQGLQVMPLVKFERLENVLVITNFKPIKLGEP